MAHATIIKYTHGFIIHTENLDIKKWIRNYAIKHFGDTEQVWSRKLYKMVTKVSTLYVVGNKNDRSIGFPIHAFEHFHFELNEFLTRMRMDLKVEEYDYKKPNHPIDFNVNGLTPRDYQLPLINYLKEDNRIRTVPLPTGQGKTLSTFFYLETLKLRTAFFFKKEHLTTWTNTIVKDTNVEEDELYIVNSTKDFIKLCNMAKAKAIPEKIKFILIPSSIMAIYINKFLEIPGHDEPEPIDLYGIHPHEFLQSIGCAHTVTDECHQLPEHVLRRAVYLNAEKNIYLSATLGSKKNQLKNKLHSQLFPKRERFKDFKENEHIDVTFMHYVIRDYDTKPDIQCQGTRGYSHNLLEQSLMQPNLHNRLMAYFDMIYDLLLKTYLDGYLPETKALILFSTQAMCTEFIKYLESHPNTLLRTLKIRRYIAMDDVQNYQQGDIVVSTPGSMGVGKDVPNLRTNIITKAVGDENLFLQMLGRTRPIAKYPDINPTCVCLYCPQIDSHGYYMKHLERDVIKRSKSFRVITGNYIV